MPDRTKEDTNEFLKDYFDERGRTRLGVLREVAGAVSATPGPDRLAWLMTRPNVTAPIASATNLIQLDELLGSAELSLSGCAIEKLNPAGR